jgi:pilus assembly protein Flp/PilA
MELIKRFAQDETGAETVEYALVLGLVALAAVVAITAVGSSLSTWWTSLSGTISGLSTG